MPPPNLLLLRIQDIDYQESTCCSHIPVSPSGAWFACLSCDGALRLRALSGRSWDPVDLGYPSKAIAIRWIMTKDGSDVLFVTLSKGDSTPPYVLITFDGKRTTSPNHTSGLWLPHGHTISVPGGGATIHPLNLDWMLQPLQVCPYLDAEGMKLASVHMAGSSMFFLYYDQRSGRSLVSMATLQGCVTEPRSGHVVKVESMIELSDLWYLSAELWELGDVPPIPTAPNLSVNSSISANNSFSSQSTVSTACKKASPAQGLFPSVTSIYVPETIGCTVILDLALLGANVYFLLQDESDRYTLMALNTITNLVIGHFDLTTFLDSYRHINLAGDSQAEGQGMAFAQWQSLDVCPHGRFLAVRGPKEWTMILQLDAMDHDSFPCPGLGNPNKDFVPLPPALSSCFHEKPALREPGSSILSGFAAKRARGSRQGAPLDKNHGAQGAKTEDGPYATLHSLAQGVTILHTPNTIPLQVETTGDAQMLTHDLLFAEHHVVVTWHKVKGHEASSLFQIEWHSMSLLPTVHWPVLSSHPWALFWGHQDIFIANSNTLYKPLLGMTKHKLLAEYIVKRDLINAEKVCRANFWSQRELHFNSLLFGLQHGDLHAVNCAVQAAITAHKSAPTGAYSLQILHMCFILANFIALTSEAQRVAVPDPECARLSSKWSILESQEDVGLDILENSFSSKGPTEFSSDDAEVYTGQQVMEGIDWFRKVCKAKDRVYHFQVYRSCFVGSETIDAMVRSRSSSPPLSRPSSPSPSYTSSPPSLKPLSFEWASRDAAVRFANLLMRLGVIRHVCDGHSFGDAYLFYRFCDDSILINLNEQYLTSGRERPQPRAKTFADLKEPGILMDTLLLSSVMQTTLHLMAYLLEWQTQCYYKILHNHQGPTPEDHVVPTLLGGTTPVWKLPYHHQCPTEQWLDMNYKDTVQGQFHSRVEASARGILLRVASSSKDTYSDLEPQPIHPTATLHSAVDRSDSQIGVTADDTLPFQFVAHLHTCYILINSDSATDSTSDSGQVPNADPFLQITPLGASLEILTLSHMMRDINKQNNALHTSTSPHSPSPFMPEPCSRLLQSASQDILLHEGSNLLSGMWLRDHFHACLDLFSNIFTCSQTSSLKEVIRMGVVSHMPSKLLAYLNYRLLDSSDLHRGSVTSVKDGDFVARYGLCIPALSCATPGSSVQWRMHHVREFSIALAHEACIGGDIKGCLHLLTELMPVKDVKTCIKHFVLHTYYDSIREELIRSPISIHLTKAEQDGLTFLRDLVKKYNAMCCEDTPCGDDLRFSAEDGEASMDPVDGAYSNNVASCVVKEVSRQNRAALCDSRVYSRVYDRKVRPFYKDIEGYTSEDKKPLAYTAMAMVLDTCDTHPSAYQIGCINKAHGEAGHSGETADTADIAQIAVASSSESSMESEGISVGTWRSNGPSLEKNEVTMKSPATISPGQVDDVGPSQAILRDTGFDFITFQQKVRARLQQAIVWRGRLDSFSTTIPLPITPRHAKKGMHPTSTPFADSVAPLPSEFVEVGTVAMGDDDDATIAGERQAAEWEWQDDRAALQELEMDILGLVVHEPINATSPTLWGYLQTNLDCVTKWWAGNIKMRVILDAILGQASCHALALSRPEPPLGSIEHSLDVGQLQYFMGRSHAQGVLWWTREALARMQGGRVLLDVDGDGDLHYVPSDPANESDIASTNVTTAIIQIVCQCLGTSAVSLAMPFINRLLVLTLASFRIFVPESGLSGWQLLFRRLTQTSQLLPWNHGPGSITWGPEAPIFQAHDAPTNPWTWPTFPYINAFGRVGAPFGDGISCTVGLEKIMPSRTLTRTHRELMREALGQGMMRLLTVYCHAYELWHALKVELDQWPLEVQLNILANTAESINDIFDVALVEAQLVPQPKVKSPTPTTPSSTSTSWSYSTSSASFSTSSASPTSPPSYSTSTKPTLDEIFARDPHGMMGWACFMYSNRSLEECLASPRLAPHHIQPSTLASCMEWAPMLKRMLFIADEHTDGKSPDLDTHGDTHEDVVNLQGDFALIHRLQNVHPNLDFSSAVTLLDYTDPYKTGCNASAAPSAVKFVATLPMTKDQTHEVLDIETQQQKIHHYRPISDFTSVPFLQYHAKDVCLGRRYYLTQGRPMAAFSNLLQCHGEVSMGDLLLDAVSQTTNTVPGLRAEVRLRVADLAKKHDLPESVLRDVTRQAYTIATQHALEPTITSSCIMLLDLCGIPSQALSVDIHCMHRILRYHPKFRDLHKSDKEQTFPREIVEAFQAMPSLLMNLNLGCNPDSGDTKARRAHRSVTDAGRSVSNQVLKWLEESTREMLTSNNCRPIYEGGMVFFDEDVNFHHSRPTVWQALAMFCTIHDLPPYTAHLEVYLEANDWLGFLFESDNQGLSCNELCSLVYAHPNMDPAIQEHLLLVIKGQRATKVILDDTSEDNLANYSELWASSTPTHSSPLFFELLLSCDKVYRDSPSEALEFLLQKAKSLGEELLAVLVHSLIPSPQATISARCWCVWLEVHCKKADVVIASSKSSTRLSDTMQRIHDLILMLSRSKNCDWTYLSQGLVLFDRHNPLKHIFEFGHHVSMCNWSEASAAMRAYRTVVPHGCQRDHFQASSSIARRLPVWRRHSALHGAFNKSRFVIGTLNWVEDLVRSILDSIIDHCPTVYHKLRILQALGEDSNALGHKATPLALRTLFFPGQFPNYKRLDAQNCRQPWPAGVASRRRRRVKRSRKRKIWKARPETDHCPVLIEDEDVVAFLATGHAWMMPVLESQCPSTEDTVQVLAGHGRFRAAENLIQCADLPCIETHRVILRGVQALVCDAERASLQSNPGTQAVWDTVYETLKSSGYPSVAAAAWILSKAYAVTIPGAVHELTKSCADMTENARNGLPSLIRKLFGMVNSLLLDVWRLRASASAFYHHLEQLTLVLSQPSRNGHGNFSCCILHCFVALTGRQFLDCLDADERELIQELDPSPTLYKVDAEVVESMQQHPELVQRWGDDVMLLAKATGHNLEKGHHTRRAMALVQHFVTYLPQAVVQWKAQPPSQPFNGTQGGSPHFTDAQLLGLVDKFVTCPPEARDKFLVPSLTEALGLFQGEAKDAIKVATEEIATHLTGDEAKDKCRGMVLHVWIGEIIGSSYADVCDMDPLEMATELIWCLSQHHTKDIEDCLHSLVAHYSIPSHALTSLCIQFCIHAFYSPMWRILIHDVVNRSKDSSVLGTTTRVHNAYLQLMESNLEGRPALGHQGLDRGLEQTGSILRPVIETLARLCDPTSGVFGMALLQLLEDAPYDPLPNQIQHEDVPIYRSARLKWAVYLITHAYWALLVNLHLSIDGILMQHIQIVVQECVQAKEWKLILTLLVSVQDYKELGWILQLLYDEGQLSLILEYLNCEGDAGSIDESLRFYILGFLKTRLPQLEAEERGHCKQFYQNANLYEDLGSMYMMSASSEFLGQLSSATVRDSRDPSFDGVYRRIEGLYTAAADVFLEDSSYNRCSDALNMKALITLQKEKGGEYMLLDLDAEGALEVIKKMPFNDALVVANAYKMNCTATWVEAIYSHHVMKGNYNFLTSFLQRFPLGSELQSGIQTRWAKELNKNQLLEARMRHFEGSLGDWEV